MKILRVFRAYLVLTWNNLRFIFLMLPDGGFRDLGNIRYYCSFHKESISKLIFNSYFKFQTCYVEVQVESSVIPQAFVCSLSCEVLDNLYNAIWQPSAHSPPQPFLVAHCHVCALDINDLVFGLWLLCSYLGSLLFFILVLHLIIAAYPVVFLEGKGDISSRKLQSLLLPLGIIQPCVFLLPWVKWKIKHICLSYNKDQPRWTIRANGRKQSFLRISELRWCGYGIFSQTQTFIQMKSRKLLRMQILWVILKTYNTVHISMP